jgi:hypothetical protein
MFETVIHSPILGRRFSAASSVSRCACWPIGMLAKPTNGVVVGSGASGSWAVKELTAGDLKVVLFEADRNVDIAHDFFTDT